MCLTDQAPAGDELAAYLAKADPSYQWKVEQSADIAGAHVWRLKLRSQTWEGIEWNHDLLVAVPSGASLATVFLLNDGGAAYEDHLRQITTMAGKIKAPVAILLGVPNQPLLGDKKEDDLIAETFARYLETGDADWPLLFPMVKSVVKAMDALQELSRKEGGQPVEHFIIGGASKRGWTTWLTAASDPRVTAITPMVIDMLDMKDQLQHQKEALGKTSNEISPYTKRGLTPDMQGERAQALWRMVDPWSYRERFTMPKLIVLGNNDPFWSTDALNLYWDGLPGDKAISYTPNAGHNLLERGGDGRSGSRDRAENNIAAFVRRQLTGQPMPKLTWTHGGEGKTLTLTVSTDSAPSEARLWLAHSDSRDFRKSHWESQPLETKAGEPVRATLERPGSGFIAYYADLRYEVDGIPEWLCTQLRIAGSEP